MRKIIIPLTPVQAGTGSVSEMNVQDHCNPLDYEKVESASLNGDFTNLGENAQYSWQMAEKLTVLIRARGPEPATPQAARKRDCTSCAVP